MHRKHLWPWPLGEGEVVDQIAEDRLGLAHIRSRIRPSSVARFSPLAAEEVILDELVVSVEADDLVNDIPALVERMDDNPRGGRLPDHREDRQPPA
jgi:hypothetical protein